MGSFNCPRIVKAAPARLIPAFGQWIVICGGVLSPERSNVALSVVVDVFPARSVARSVIVFWPSANSTSKHWNQLWVNSCETGSKFLVDREALEVRHIASRVGHIVTDAARCLGEVSFNLDDRLGGCEGCGGGFGDGHGRGTVSTTIRFIRQYGRPRHPLETNQTSRAASPAPRSSVKDGRNKRAPGRAGEISPSISTAIIPAAPPSIVAGTCT